ncbi:hypothetical protein ABS858_13260 [Vibrio neptunius]|uniref:hypothetical protein n=1 Tax=Vibrio neptunius TaxID=170651 RepID=UPI003314D648
MKMNKDVQNIDFIDLCDLELDKCNPRLPSKLKKKKPRQEDIVNWMLGDASIIELMLAIGQAGFFIGEALLVVKENDRFVVVEGNRRLTSCILLSNPKIAKSQTKKIDKVLSETTYRPDPIPCIIFPNREKINKYLGYRHVTGVKSWGVLPKARYLSELSKELDESDLTIKCRTLAKSIGSRSDHVKKLLIAYEIYEEVEDEAFYKIGGLDETTLHFNYFVDSLSRDNIRGFLNIDLKSDEPLSELDKDNLNTLTHWYFEKNENNRSRVMGDSNHLSMLDKVLGDQQALEYFETGSGSIQDAYNLVSITADSYNQEIEVALKGLKQANAIIHNVEQHHGAVKQKLKEISKLARNMYTIIDNMEERDEWDD